MKSNKGITLISLIVYIIVFCIVIGTVSMLSGYFTRNVDEVVISSSTSEKYTRLTTYITNDMNSINFKDISVKEDFIDIIFLDGTQHIYLYNDDKIYYIEKGSESNSKTITVCDKITNCNFTIDEKNNKLKISITIDGIIYNNNYSIKQ